MSLRYPSLLTALALAAAVLWSPLAHAADLQVSPVRLELANEDSSRPLWLSNSGQQPIHVQVQVYKWEQTDGTETLIPTTEVVATPAITQIAPGGRQLVRIVRRGAPVPGEQAYRLRVEELPQPNRFQSGTGPALNLLLAYSIPVFLGTPEATAPPRLAAHIRNGEMTLTNSGTSRVMVSDLKAVDHHGQVHTLRPGLVGYVLAGQTMTFPFEAAPNTRALRATLNQGDAQDWALSP